MSATARRHGVHGHGVHRDHVMRKRAVHDRSVHDLVPLCVVGDRILTELVDVTDDLGALDSSGLWALVLPYSGRAVSRDLRVVDRRGLGPGGRGAGPRRMRGRRVSIAANSAPAWNASATRSDAATCTRSTSRAGCLRRYRSRARAPRPTSLRSARRWRSAIRRPSARSCGCLNMASMSRLRRPSDTSRAVGSVCGPPPSKARRPNQGASPKRTGPKT